MQLLRRRKDKPLFLFNIFIITGAAVLFFFAEWVFVMWILSETPYWHIALTVCFAVVLLWCYASLLCCFILDPGTLPRNLDAMPPDPTTATENNVYPFTQDAHLIRQQDIIINGGAYRLRYCYTCQLLRPPRCSHCSICDSCIESHDHHCPWVGNCIGKRNYRSFVVFVMTATALCFYAFALSVTHVVLVMRQVNEGNLLLELAARVPVSLVLALVSMILGLSLIGLALYHIRLVCTNETTHEKIRRGFNHDTSRNVFDRGGCLANVWHFCAAPQYESHLDVDPH